ASPDQRRSLHRRYSRNRQVCQTMENALDVDRAVPAFEPFNFGEVDAGAETSTGAADDDRTDFLVVLERGDGLVERFHDGFVESIALFGTVKGDRRVIVAAFD